MLQSHAAKYLFIDCPCVTIFLYFGCDLFFVDKCINNLEGKKGHFKTSFKQIIKFDNMF
jgi:hypothetical protein